MIPRYDIVVIEHNIELLKLQYRPIIYKINVVVWNVYSKIYVNNKNKFEGIF
jgi:hypothetical protein